MLKELVLVACGGAVGACGRYLVFIAAASLLGKNYPFGTLIVNVTGSFILGVLAEGMALAWNIPAQTRLFLVVGLLGAYTTFSTFSLDVALLWERNQFLAASLYALSSVVLSIGGLFAGLALIRHLLAPSL